MVFLLDRDVVLLDCLVGTRQEVSGLLKLNLGLGKLLLELFTSLLLSIKSHRETLVVELLLFNQFLKVADLYMSALEGLLELAEISPHVLAITL